MTVCYNGDLMSEAAVEIEWGNRAFYYGDGLFETVIVRDGQPSFWADHYQRLITGMAVLGLQIPVNWSEAYLQNLIVTLLQRNGLGQQARLRLQVWRKSGGLYTPTQQAVDFLMTLTPYTTPANRLKAQVVISDTVKLHFDSLSPLKTCNALPYVQAGLERQQKNADEIILTDIFGHLAECQAANLFWFKQGTLYTPSIQSGCINGIMRKQVIATALSTGVEVQEGLWHLSDLAGASHVFGTNVTGIYPMHNIEGQSFEAEVPVFLQQFDRL